MRDSTLANRRGFFAKVVILALGQGVSGSVISLLTAVSSLVGGMLAPSAGLATVPVTAPVIGAMAMVYPISALMHRLGRRWAFLLGSGLGVAGAGVAGFGIYEESFGVFIFGTFILGLFSAFNQYYRFAAADLAESPTDRARAISYVMAGGILGGFLGPFVASRSADLSPLPFLGAFAALVVICIFLAVLQFFFEDGAKKVAAISQAHARSLRQILVSRNFGAATLSCAIGFGVMTLLMNATPLAMQGCGFSLAESATVIQWHFVAMYAPALVSGALMARIGVQRLILLGVAANLVGVAVAMSALNYLNFWVALVCFGIGWSCMFTGGTTLLTGTYTEAEKPRAQGLNSLIVYLTNALASFSAGSMLSLGGWAAVNLVAVPILVFAGAFTVWSMRLERETLPAK
jgi:MFS family permease